ncbi:hypothetical protein VHP8226_03919 [Vibrio hippocampi]|uniref:Cation efflux protein transmembrane domain-containing protein n=1 Tax=Vibrio hippocampi TaxID=654686 RepID=A0ABM8ZNW4_9VIBR|nr:cation transporter [Vibrio hippocampi]CAH0530245.1 hypothetical protein VHP8226_03919 [Vibrio hippocampi]
MKLQFQHQETRILTFSALIATAFAVGGLVVGILMGSLVIAFDGVYSLISLLLTLLSLTVAGQLKQPKSKLSEFARHKVESVVVIVKASVILMLVIASLYSAIEAMFTGGRPVNTSVATLFGLVNVVGCGYAWWYIAQRADVMNSVLVDAESKQWKMDTLLSVAVTIGFIATYAVELSPFASFSHYADPMMMILMSVYFIKVPADMLRQAHRSLLTDTPTIQSAVLMDVERPFVLR